MNALLLRIKLGFEGLSPREKKLITLSGWISVLCVGLVFYIEPKAKELMFAQSQIEQNKLTVATMQELNAIKEQKLSISPDLELEKKLTELKKLSESLRIQMEDRVEGLVDASDMPGLMEDVLKQSQNLSLLSMASLPPTQLTSTEEAGFYVHPISMTFKGSYFDTVKYLESLEALPVKYYWRSVDYRLIEYPWAEVTIQVYTLSESAVFIGGTQDVSK